MGAGASVTIQNEMTKPLDASDVATPRGESAKAEVIRLRRMIYDQQRAERLKCAVMGSMLGDAASSTLLWHYDPEKLKELVGYSDALFFPKEHTCDYLKAFQEHGHYNPPSSFSHPSLFLLFLRHTFFAVVEVADTRPCCQRQRFHSGNRHGATGNDSTKFGGQDQCRDSNG